MRLDQLVSEDAVCVNMAATERDDAIREMLHKLVDCNRLEEGMLEPVLAALIEREQMGSTAIGNGVAVPHARLKGLSGTVIAFGISGQGVSFNALDGGLVHQIFLVIASGDESGEYLEAMQKVSRLVQNRDFRRFMLAAKDEREALALIKEMSD